MSDPNPNMGCGSKSIESICGLRRISSSSPSQPTWIFRKGPRHIIKRIFRHYYPKWRYDL